MWKLNDVIVYVEDDSGWKPTPRKGMINLLDTDYTIIHTAGRESHQRDLTFVVFSGFTTSILPLADDASVNLLDDEGNTTAVTILDLQPERLYDYHDRKVHRVKISVIMDDAP